MSISKDVEYIPNYQFIVLKMLTFCTVEIIADDKSLTHFRSSTGSVPKDLKTQRALIYCNYLAKEARKRDSILRCSSRSPSGWGVKPIPINDFERGKLTFLDIKTKFIIRFASVFLPSSKMILCSSWILDPDLEFLDSGVKRKRVPLPYYICHITTGLVIRSLGSISFSPFRLEFSEDFACTLGFPTIWII